MTPLERLLAAGGQLPTSARNKWSAAAQAQTIPQPSDPQGGGDWFLAEITAVTGTGASATYSFTEVNVIGTTGGGVENRTSGRQADANNPARYAGSGTLAVDDIVIARRNVANVNEFEILTAVGSAGGAGTPGTSPGGGPCELAALRTENAVTVSTASGDFLLTWDSVNSVWTSADAFTYPTGDGVFAFWFDAGQVHLSLDGLELLNCGNGCFTGGPLTGHDAQTGSDCDGDVFTVCVSCTAGTIALCADDQPTVEVPLSLTATVTANTCPDAGNDPIVGHVIPLTYYDYIASTGYYWWRSAPLVLNTDHNCTTVSPTPLRLWFRAQCNDPVNGTDLTANMYFGSGSFDHTSASPCSASGACCWTTIASTFDYANITGAGVSFSAAQVATASCGCCSSGVNTLTFLLEG